MRKHWAKTVEMTVGRFISEANNSSELFNDGLLQTLTLTWSSNVVHRVYESIGKCSRCGADFFRNSNSQKYCKDCSKEVTRLNQRKADKKWRELHPDEVKQHTKDYYYANKEIRNKQRIQAKRDNIEHEREVARLRWPKNPEKNRENRLKFVASHPNWQRDYNRERYHTDIDYKLRVNFRNRMRYAMRGIRKTKSSLELLGCTVDEYRQHIESLFTDGMNWDEVFKGHIHIDHKIPLIAFDLNDPNQQSIAFNWRNLQPLWATDNFKKMSQDIKLNWRKW